MGDAHLKDYRLASKAVEMLGCCEGAMDIVVIGSTAHFTRPAALTTGNGGTRRVRLKRRNTAPATMSMHEDGGDIKRRGRHGGHRPRDKNWVLLHRTCEHHDQESKLELVLKPDPLSILPKMKIPLI